MDALDLAIMSVKTLTLYLLVLHVVPIMVWVERKGAALIQDRPGPNRVGPFGLLQPIADFIKLIWKEDPIPRQANALLFVISPFLMVLAASLVLATIPFGDHLILWGRNVPLQIADIDVAILYVLAISSMGIYGILFGGWASNNKFSLMGALRAASQMISYELPIGLALVGIVMVFGTFSLREMTLQQEGLWFGMIPKWGVFLQPVGFLLFLICSFAETNRLPFDLPESEAELVAGFHTEYGSMKFAGFFMAEYMNMTTISALMVTLYFGGWHIPWVTDQRLLALLGSQNLLGLLQIGVLMAKVFLFLIFFVWVRWTLPRFRFDQLLGLCWKSLIPLALANIVVTSLIMYGVSR